MEDKLKLSEEQVGIIEKAVKEYGVESQTTMLFEEMAELQNSICKFQRGRDTSMHICEEIADVIIMCYQMAHIFGVYNVREYIWSKLNRLETRLNQGE